MITALRRTTELGLVVLAALITVGLYTLASLGTTASIPANIGPFLGLILGLFGLAHVATRRLAPSADGTLLPLAGLLCLAGCRHSTELPYSAFKTHIAADEIAEVRFSAGKLEGVPTAGARAAGDVEVIANPCRCARQSPPSATKNCWSMRDVSIQRSIWFRVADHSL